MEWSSRLGAENETKEGALSVAWTTSKNHVATKVLVRALCYKLRRYRRDCVKHPFQAQNSLYHVITCRERLGGEYIAACAVTAITAPMPYISYLKARDVNILVCMEAKKAISANPT